MRDNANEREGDGIKKTYHVKRISEEYIPGFINEFNKVFYDQANFLDPLQQNRIVIGRKGSNRYCNRIKQSFSIIDYQPRVYLQKKLNLFQKDKRSLETIESVANHHVANTKKVNFKRHINDNDIKMLFARLKKRAIRITSRNIDDDYLNHIPNIDIISKRKLRLQGKALKKWEDIDNDSKRIEEFISSKVKKTQGELLMSKTFQYKIKQDSLSYMKRSSDSNNNCNGLLSCRNSWENTLRLKQKAHINCLSVDFNSRISLDLNKRTDIINSPLFNSDLTMIQRLRRVQSNDNINLMMFEKRLKDFGGLAVNGENLMKIEENQIKEFKGRKMLVEYVNNNQTKLNSYTKDVIAEEWSCKKKSDDI